jgi:hypothetical protein
MSPQKWVLLQRLAFGRVGKIHDTYALCLEKCFPRTATASAFPSCKSFNILPTNVKSGRKMGGNICQLTSGDTRQHRGTFYHTIPYCFFQFRSDRVENSAEQEKLSRVPLNRSGCAGVLDYFLCKYNIMRIRKFAKIAGLSYDHEATKYRSGHRFHNCSWGVALSCCVRVCVCVCVCILLITALTSLCVCV